MLMFVMMDREGAREVDIVGGGGVEVRFNNRKLTEYLTFQ